MAQEEIKYTIPNDGGGDAGSQVDITVTYDNTTQNADGSFTVTNATGTYQTLDANGNVVNTDQITGIAAAGTYGNNDNKIFIVANPTTSDIVSNNGITYTINNNNDSNDGNGNVNFYSDGNNDNVYNEGGNNSQPASSVSEAAVCFCTGVRISTNRGEVAVEDLRVGDLAILSSGDRRAIRWIGSRTIDCRYHPRPYDVYPVRIRAGAFGIDGDGEAVPANELRLSPGHPVLVGANEDSTGGTLVPIMCLINGTSIARAPVDSVTYWHIELEGAHDIILAEGLPAESYLDWGDRAFFEEAADHALHNPDHVASGLGARCRPVAVDGPLVEAERRRLDGVFAAFLTAQAKWPGINDALIGF